MASQFKTIAVVGAGALGLYYGGRLARAGNDVTFLARSDRALLRAQGLTVKAPDGEFMVLPDAIRVEATPQEIGPVDLVIVTLKATANGELVKLLPPLLHERTVVMNFQNGLGVDEQVAAVVGVERTIGGLCFVCVNRTAPGVAECTMAGHIVAGEFAGASQERTRALKELFVKAGVKMSVSENLLEVRWRKLVWNVPFNGLAVTGGGITTDMILQSAKMEAEVWALMREVQAAAAAYGVVIPEDFVVDQVERTRPMGAYKPSTMIDFVAGKPLEVEPIWGEPLRRAKAKSVSTPRLKALYARLKELSP
ncbi:2-dehydropantoate 2-reductase [Rariglobus hedericola]|uniref:2-dehydropantoate 2-reductase n=1 Tax=Rariglobus hedericola TaxID=2597822 RepID=A0A556QJT6_9BACT|nr:2-dehydropantoate 2-reductase [Rariglobus hedericola]TSJ76906.1 2-dehydropantoate 2-reductase [Rariglobus hedericola]